MATQVIRILKGNPDGTLDLSDRGRTRAGKGDTINWQIDNNSGVDEIVLIEKKASSPDVFTDPPRAQGAIWRGDIDRNALDNADCHYSITWRDKDGNTQVYDPVISIKPSPLHSREFAFVAGVAVGIVVGMCTMSLLQHKKKHKGVLPELFSKLF